MTLYSNEMKSPTRFLAVFIALFFSFAFPAFPQSATERATRETDLSQKKEIEKHISKPPQETPIQALPEVPGEEAEQKFFVKKINLVGTQSFTSESFQTLLSVYENKEITLTSLKYIAKQIEQEYLKRGIVAACFIPPQESRDHIFTLQVIETKMGELYISDHKWFKNVSLKKYWAIPKGEVIRYQKLRESLLRMNKNPDRRVTSALQAGKEPQTTDVLLDVKTDFPVHVVGSLDNEGIPSTGKLRQSIGGRHNNFLGLDDTLFSGYSFGKDFGGYYIYHSLPIKGSGTSFFYGYSQSWSEPQLDFSGSGLKSISKSGTLMLRQDLYYKGDYLGEVFLGLDMNNKGVNQHTGTVTNDRLRILTLGGNFFVRGNGRLTVFSPKFSQGIGALGATDRNNPEASRDASTVFSIFNFNLTHRRDLPLGLTGVFKAQSQFATTRLTSQETLGLGGIDSLRGYPAGDFLADHAVITNMDILFPTFFVPKEWQVLFLNQSWRETAQFLTFFDYGWGHRFGHIAGERGAVNYASTGVGLRIKLKDKASFRFEWGFPLSEDAATEAASSHFHFSIDFQV